MSNMVIIVSLAIILTFAVKNTVSHFKGESSCCGGGSKDVKTKPAKLKQVVSTKIVKIDGMHCEHCYTRVANLFNSMEGVNAKVYGKRGEAVLKFEKIMSDDEIKKIIEDNGYEVVSITEK
ncbi:MAG: heavy-metal-associated domain-containing protein [Butyrivibrio sp.]|nr:heavy-metal-associated domain-containing protein [Butyrivibrio sp.]